MKCTIREFDQLIIRGLRTVDSETHNRCVRRLFYDELEPLLRSIQRSLYKGSIEYDELVNELYLFLSRNNWRILESFQGRNGARISTWLSHIAWHYFLCAYKRESRIEYLDNLTPIDGHIYTITQDEMRIDIENTLSRMNNERYVFVIRLLIIEGRGTEEVAKLMGTTIQNIYNIKHRAIAQFLDIYK